MNALPFSFANKNGVVLGMHPDIGRVLYCLEQTSPTVLMEVQRVFGSEDLVVRPLSESAFEKQLQAQYASQSSNSIEAMDELDIPDLDQAMAEVATAEDLLNSNDDAPIIKLLNAILAEAIRKNASDIHIETFETQLRVRFRIDGQLKVVLTPKIQFASMLVSRIKVMAKLDIAEKRLPQDGRIAIKLGGRAVDLRISTIPSSFGERVVMRLLDKSSGRLDLTDLGLPDEQLSRLKKLLQKPHGILLVTGPTGSGKTTTLYAGLSRLNDNQRNIMTVEDPIEYNIEGINQTQVNTKAEMTFAKGLRAILRQDPDVVMIGEIRDYETAEIAVQASLTGHLVLSTLHTNTAVGAISRLKDMGVEPFLLSSSLLGVMAQRLVRQICPECGEQKPADDAECQMLGVASAEIMHPVGCEACSYTGYQGRIGIYELLEIDNTVRQMIHSGESDQAIETYVHQTTPSIYQSAMQLVLNRQTSLEEVMRVVQR